MSTKTIIACPECKHEFHPEEALELAVREKLTSEFSQREEENAIRIKKDAEAQASAQLATMREELDRSKSIHANELREAGEKLTKIENEKAELQTQARELNIKQSALDEREKNINETLAQKQKEYESQINDRMLAEFKRRELGLEEKARQLETYYLQQANTEVERVTVANNLKVMELEKKLSDQVLLVEEMNRKHAQGSMQLQGEVAELFIEEELRNLFPLDEILPVAKGRNGADSIQTVFNPNKVACGKIIYESKRTKHFSNEWLDKLKIDMRAENCDVAVLVTEALPKELNRFGCIDGIWICTFYEFRSVAQILRSGLLRAGDIIMAQENKGTKMQILYDYLTGPQFRSHVEGIVEAFGAMKTSLDKEKKLYHKLWAEREKQLERIMQGASGMYGSIQGISGSAIQEIKSLEIEEGLLIDNT